MLLVKRTRGGFAGYPSQKVIRRLKMPPSQGVSSGPKMLADHMRRFSSEHGLALQPSGGEWEIAFRSDNKRSEVALGRTAVAAIRATASLAALLTRTVQSPASFPPGQSAHVC